MIVFNIRSGDGECHPYFIMDWQTWISHRHTVVELLYIMYWSSCFCTHDWTLMRTVEPNGSTLIWLLLFCSLFCLFQLGTCKWNFGSSKTVWILQLPTFGSELGGLGKYSVIYLKWNIIEPAVSTCFSFITSSFCRVISDPPKYHI